MHDLNVHTAYTIIKSGGNTESLTVKEKQTQTKISH